MLGGAADWATPSGGIGVNLPRSFGGYELLEEVARGGMGVVYRARQKQANRVVAVKVLASGAFAAPDFVKRFRTEAEAVARLDHPQIVPIYEVSECEGQSFFSMKLIESGTLAARIKAKSQIPNSEAADLLAKLAHAVHFAHQRGILHRDIKPGNVLMDPRGEPLLTDFGLAKLVEKDSTLTRTVAMLGTPSYMSPEQARGEAKQLTTAVDVYGLGAVFYELLTGQPPFAGGTTMETVRQVLEMEPRPPTALRPGTDRDLETICLKCLEKEPARRYASAEELAQDLERWQRQEPVSARPPSTAYRLQKSWRRNRLAYLTGIAVVSALVAGLVLATAGWRQARKERDLAQDRLYESLVREADSIGIIRPLGYRHELMDRIRRALALPTARKNLDVLRSEAAQSLGDAMSLDKVSLVNPPAPVLGFDLSPDGTFVAFSTASRELVLHETIKGTAVARLGTPGRVVQLAFAPSGQSLFGRTEESVKMVEWARSAQGSWARRTERSLPELRRLIATRQGVITAGEDPTSRKIQLVDAETHRSVGSIPWAVGEGFPWVVDLALEKQLAVLSGSTNPAPAIEVCDLATGQRQVELNPGLGPIQSLRFSPDERFLACTAEFGVIVYETSEFKPINTYRSFTSSGAVWGGDGTILCVPLGQEVGVRLFSIHSGNEVAWLRTQHEVGNVRCSADGSTLVTLPLSAGETFVVRLVDTHERVRLTGHIGGVPGLEFSPDGMKIASTGKDGTIRIWDVLTGKQLQVWEIRGRSLPGQTVAFSPDGRWLVSGNYENDEVVVWSVETGRTVLALGKRQPGSRATWSCAFSPDGKVLVAAGEGLRGWELVASQPAGADEPAIVARELFTDPGYARNVQFHPSGKWLGFQADLNIGGRIARGSFARSLDPESKPELIDRDSWFVQSLGTSGSGVWIYTSPQRILKFWDPQTRRIARTLPTLTSGESSSSYVMNFRLSPDGTRAAIASQNGVGVNIHDVINARRLYSLPEEPGAVWWLAWHPNGRHLAVARANGDISLWDLNAVEAVLADVGLAPGDPSRNPRAQ